MNTTVVKILLVEDSTSDADLLQEMLHLTGLGRFEFTTVDRLDEALVRLSQKTFDVLLLDLSLPDSSGPDTFLRARNAAPQVPIVVSTNTNGRPLCMPPIEGSVAPPWPSAVTCSGTACASAPNRQSIMR